MRTVGIFIFLCINMLLGVGCQPTPEIHKLRSSENLLTRAIHSTQINRLSWRKLLDENSAANLNRIKEDTVNASAITEPKDAETKHAATNATGKAEVRDVKEGGVAVDVKKEEEKPDPAPLTAQKEAGKRKDTALAKKVEEPKSDVNQEPSKQGNEGEHKDTDGTEKEEVEISKIDPELHAQAVQVEDKSAVTSVNESVTNEQEQADQSRDKIETSGERELQDNLAKESSNLTENTGSKKELAEVNPIKLVANTSSEVNKIDTGVTDKVALTSEPEGIVKEQIAHENGITLSKEKVDNLNNITDDSNEVTSNTADIKVEDGNVKDKIESSGSLGIKQEKSADATIVVSKEESGEKEDKKQEARDNDGDKQSESNETESNQKEDEKQEARDDDGDKQNESIETESNEKEDEKRELIGDNGDKPNESNETGSNEEKADESQDSSPGNVENKDEESEENSSKDSSVVSKSDDETEAATKEVELQLEALKRGTVIETSVEQMKERDLSEDEYDIIQELADLPTKFQETAGKVADHLRPDVIKWKDTSKVYFNLANQQITESFSPLIGQQYAPFFASMISYGILLLPLIVVILLFDHIKALFSLQKVLLFINIYLAAYFATLWLASFIIGLEPMSFFYLNSLSSYLSLQLLQGLGYFVYLTLQTANLFHSCTADTLAGKVTSALQWMVAMAIGLHYYVTVFHPAVASKPPHTSWKFYAIYTAAFIALCLFARIKWVKKQYVTPGSNVADKKS